jgi:hypothetical protein
VKPQVWREAAAAIAGSLDSKAVIISVAAGVRAADIGREAFGGRRVASGDADHGGCGRPGRRAFFSGSQGAPSRPAPSSALLGHRRGFAG